MTEFKKYNRKYIIIQNLDDASLPGDSEVIGEGIVYVYTPTGKITDAERVKVGDGTTTFGNLTWFEEDSGIVTDIVTLATPTLSISDSTVTATISQPYGTLVIPYTYEIVPKAPGASYGFALNASGWWESENGLGGAGTSGDPTDGEHYSAAVCRVQLHVNIPTNIQFEVINFAEDNYDYGVFGKLDTALAVSYDNDVENTSQNVYINFKDDLYSSKDIQTVVYSNVPIGDHFIDIKFRKDMSVDNGNDSIQFRLPDISAGATSKNTLTLNSAELQIKRQLDPISDVELNIFDLPLIHSAGWGKVGSLGFGANTNVKLYAASGLIYAGVTWTDPQDNYIEKSYELNIDPLEAFEADASVELTLNAPEGGDVIIYYTTPGGSASQYSYSIPPSGGAMYPVFQTMQNSLFVVYFYNGVTDGALSVYDGDGLDLIYEHSANGKAIRVYKVSSSHCWENLVYTNE